jgi:hypothetical protein
MRILVALLQVASATPNRVQLRFDTAEAVAVLRQDWPSLFGSAGYQRLKAREASLHREFTDSDFAAFVRSDSLARRAGDLRRALSEWERVDVSGAAARALAYLPADARIHATVYVVIKPRTNSFVYDVRTNPAIFLSLDPATTGPQFENTVAHELHHIGYASVAGRTDSIVAALPDSVRRAVEWLGAFGEGFAMLAAAGGPGVHPHATSPPTDRARWDHDAAQSNQDLRTVERFFLDVITHRLTAPDSIQAAAFAFYGVQGPWYTVGWKMAVVIESRFGRDELIRCMLNPVLLVTRYNAAARAHNRVHADTLALWSAPFVKALGMEEP